MTQSDSSRDVSYKIMDPILKQARIISESLRVSSDMRRKGDLRHLQKLSSGSTMVWLLGYRHLKLHRQNQKKDMRGPFECFGISLMKRNPNEDIPAISFVVPRYIQLRSTNMKPS